MAKGTSSSVREEPGVSPPPETGPAVRVKMRLDFHPNLQRIDWSVIAWEHPASRVIINEEILDVGPLMHESLLDDIYATLCQLFDDHSDPFP